MAVAIATLVGVTALYCGEMTYYNIKDSGAPAMQRLPGWRAHMAAACVGTLAFVTALFLLESLGGRSRSVALRSAAQLAPTGGAYGVGHRNPHSDLSSDFVGCCVQPVGLFADADLPLGEVNPGSHRAAKPKFSFRPLRPHEVVP